MKLRSRGFLFIELFFAVIILSAVIVAALVLFINCMYLSASSANLVTAAGDANYALEQIKAQQFANIPAFVSSYPSDKFNNLASETIIFPGPVYTSSLDTITVTVSWSERNGTKTFSLVSRFSG